MYFREAYEQNFNWILVIICVGLACVLCIRTNPEERNQEGYYFSIFGKKIIHLKKRKTQTQTEEEGDVAQHQQ